jgi:hypothetical protein
LVLCEARLRPADGWEDLTRFLDGAYTASEDKPGVWHELVEIRPDEQVIRAVLRREGDELLIDANSETRFERVLSRLAGATEVVAQTVQPMGSPAELEAIKDALPSGDPPEPLDPDMADQIVDMIERRWLDEEVPALGGITPRQAAVDPTRREDLIALLRSFDRMDVGESISMRPDVLRTHLGLET